MTTGRIEVSVFPLLARAVADHGAPFMPFQLREGGPVAFPDAGVPFRLYPEHRDLPQWTAANSARHLHLTRPPDEPAQ